MTNKNRDLHLNSRRIVRLADGRLSAIGEDGAYEFLDGPTATQELSAGPIASFWEIAKATAPEGSIDLIGVGATEAFLALVLRQQNLQVAKDAALRVVLTDDYLRPEVGELVLQHQRCLLAKTVGRTIWVGPLVQTGKGPCFPCLRWWLTLNRYPQNSMLLAGAAYAPDHSVARLPGTEAMAAGWLGTLTALLAAGVEQPELDGGILHFDTVTQRMTRSNVVRRGDCPECGIPGASQTPLTDFDSRYTGLVRDMEFASLLGFHVARGVCMQSYPRDRKSRIVAPQTVGGKGSSREEAHGACLGEAMERYALVFQGSEQAVTGCAGDIAGIMPNELLCYSEKQVAERSDDDDDFLWTPRRFDPARAISWVEASSLSGGPPRFLPLEYCYFWVPGNEWERLCIADSNGCACAPDIERAQLAGLLELIERDAVSIWWYNRLRRPSVDLATVRDMRLNAALSECDRAGWDAQLLDVTTEFSIPVYVACLRNRLDGRLTLGSAAHLEPAVAAYKALAEAALVEWWSEIAGRKSKLSVWLATVRPETHTQITGNGVTTMPSLRRFPGASEGLAWAVRQLGKSGVEAFWVNLTRPETSWPVVRVVAPGLRHFNPRFGAGRLYEVPVQMGWLSAARRESEMERTPLRF